MLPRRKRGPVLRPPPHAALAAAGPWILEEPLGTSGTLFRARHELTGERACVKALPATLLVDAIGRARRRRELTATRYVSHPGVCRALDFLETGEGLFLVQELVLGQPLATLLQPGVRLPLEGTLEVFGRIAEAVGAAHACHVIHGGLEPDKVLLRPDGSVCIVGFGFADEPPPANSAAPDDTDRCRAPERWAGAASTPEGDVYALGAMLLRVLGGRFPHEGATRADIARLAQTQAALSLGELVPDAPLGLNECIARALALDASARQPHAAALEQELFAALEEARLVAPLEAAGAAPIEELYSFEDLLPDAVAVSDEEAANAATEAAFLAPEPEIALHGAPPPRPQIRFDDGPAVPPPPPYVELDDEPAAPPSLPHSELDDESAAPPALPHSELDDESLLPYVEPDDELPAPPLLSELELDGELLLMPEVELDGELPLVPEVVLDGEPPLMPEVDLDGDILSEIELSVEDEPAPAAEPSDEGALPLPHAGPSVASSAPEEELAAPVEGRVVDIRSGQRLLDHKPPRRGPARRWATAAAVVLVAGAAVAGLSRIASLKSDPGEQGLPSTVAIALAAAPSAVAPENLTPPIPDEAHPLATSDEGASDEGASDEGASDDGASDEGASDEGASDEGASDEGASDEGASDEGASDEGASDEGASDEGASDEGASDEGASDEGASDKAASSPLEAWQLAQRALNDAIETKHLVWNDAATAHELRRQAQRLGERAKYEDAATTAREALALVNGLAIDEAFARAKLKRLQESLQDVQGDEASLARARGLAWKARGKIEADEPREANELLTAGFQLVYRATKKP
jgi:serine/threonine protein kinase